VAATRSIGSAEAQVTRPLALPLTWPRWEVVALVAVTVLALFLRFHQVSDAPLFTDNLDEIQFTWAGLNLILHGDAYTWSFAPGYPAYIPYTAFGVTVPTVHHWLDHPPLFSLLMGGWVWLLGVRDMTGFSAAQVRFLPVLFSTMTVPLTYFLGRRFLGPLAAICGAALLASTPGAILLGRQAEPESLQAVLLLVALLLGFRVVDRRSGVWTEMALVVCCVAAPLLKVSGIAIAGITAVILVASGRWRLAAAVGCGGLAGLLIFALYGAFIDWGLFLRAQSVHAGFRIGVMSAFDFISAPAGINRRLRDGWWLLGWIGLGLMAARNNWRRQLFGVWPAVAFAATMLVLAGERQVEQYGWYRQIIYPEVYLGAGWVAALAVRRQSLGLLGLTLVLGGATATNWWLGGPVTAWVPSPLVLSLLMLVVLGPTAVLAYRRNRPLLRRWAVGVTSAALLLMLLGNLVESVWLDRIFIRL